MTATLQQVDIDAARLLALVESSDRALIATDRAGIITAWNPEAERMFGYTAAQAVGAPLSLLHPSGEPDEETAFLQDLQGGRASIKRFDGVRAASDGRLVEVRIIVATIEDTDGRVIGGSFAARDITEERRIQKALSASEVRYRRLFESAKDGILILDADTGRVVDVNPFLVALLGHSREEFLERRLWELGFLSEIVAHEERFQKLREKEYARYESLPLRTASGESIDVEFISSVYLVEGVKVVQCNIRDVSDRRKAERAVQQLHDELEQRVALRTAELETANRELEAFSYSVSHDLRAPLRTMDAFSQAVLEDYASLLPEEGQRYLKLIRGGAQKMGALIDDLLTFSRLGRAPLNKQPVNTRQIVQAALDELLPARADRTIDVRVGELPASASDSALLKQVWVNLLSNAFKYSRHRAEAQVEIGCESTAEGATYFVRDNGTGFDMKYAGKLFGVFQRLHRAEEYEGTGVGLAIVHRIVHRHGGRVWAEAAPEQGATFRFHLGETRS